MAGETYDDAGKEISASVGPTGITGRAKGYRVVDLVFIVGALGLVWGVWELKAHAGDSDRQAAAIIKSINEANSAVVNSLKESNATIKESNSATVKALQELAAEQKRATIQITIGNCMNEPAMKNRPDSREACTRIIRRGDDR